MGSCPVQVFKWTRAVLNPLYFSLLPESLDRMSLLTEVADSLKLIADISPNLDCLALQGEWDDLIQAQVKLLGLLSKPQINADANDKATDHQYQNQAIINMEEQPRDNTVGNSVINDVEVSNTAINDVEVGNTAIDNVEVGNTAIDDVEVDNTGINNVEVGNTEIGDMEVGNTEIDDVEVGNTEIADVEVGNTEIDDVEVGDTVEFEVSENGDVINESGDIRTIFAKNWKSGKAANFSNNGGNVLVIADNLDLLKQNEGSRAIAQARSEPITSYIEGAQQQLIFVTGAILESEDKTSDDVCLKVEEDIYVDIVLAPREDSQNSEVDPTQTTNSKDKDNPLNKLCQLLRIDEEEGVDKRCEEFERKRKYENNMPYKYFCTQCSFKAKRENHYQKHLKLHEKHHSLYTCNKCQFRTIRIGMLRRHEMQHNVERLVNCKLCSYKTDSSKLLVKHFQAKHTGNRRMLRCDECEFRSGSQRDLNVHKRMHDPVKPIEYWNCNQCAYRTQYKGHLGRHKNDMHGEARPFLCHHCGKSFKRHETLKQHKIVHGEVARTYACPHCSKNCRTAGQLKEHMMVHSTHRPILCELCGATFKTRSVYYRHVKKLHSDVSFQCNICKLPFTNKTALVKHARTHRLEDESLIIKKEVTDS